MYFYDALLLLLDVFESILDEVKLNFGKIDLTVQLKSIKSVIFTNYKNTHRLMYGDFH